MRRLTKVVGAALLAVLIGAGQQGMGAQGAERTVRIVAKKFEYQPNLIKLKRGEPVVLQFVSADRLHGFSCPGLNIRATIEPGKATTVRVVPDKVGVFPFHCDLFCGEGHDEMTGNIAVSDEP
ncbi:cupredoxin domain-containing protein [Geomesophilobacter sediminis]|uniref:Cupredoxin domain-containing protein n=1 Tax=Geomesophilobacter sediminis TaxID=2798584 RepID=A0A8J7LYC5_9BACT|nr:cupredoxin domain-containing protein [Geomesophilobacter sediminis]MBJ6724552.1 cupredoxin domain-containing protein [Geomesophilobacter sediminis]